VSNQANAAGRGLERQAPRHQRPCHRSRRWIGSDRVATPDFLITWPRNTAPSVSAAVVLQARRADPGHKPRHDRPGTFVIARVRWRQRRQARRFDLPLMRCHARHRNRWWAPPSIHLLSKPPNARTVPSRHVHRYRRTLSGVSAGSDCHGRYGVSRPATPPALPCRTAVRR